MKYTNLLYTFPTNVACTYKDICEKKTLQEDIDASQKTEICIWKNCADSIYSKNHRYLLRENDLYLFLNIMNVAPIHLAGDPDISAWVHGIQHAGRIPYNNAAVIIGVSSAQHFSYRYIDQNF